MGFLDRTKIIFGEDGISNLQKAKVIVFGVGGVGGYVCEMLARCGIGTLAMVDFDVVSDSNLNRQIVALNSTLGKLKIDVMKNRILDINPNCNVLTFNTKLLPDNLNQFDLKQYDYVIDCIDMITSKIALIKYCHSSNINIISSMGTGNKNGIPNFKVCDLFQTKYDKLAKVLRHELKKQGVNNHLVVCTDEQPLKVGTVVGSVVYYPAMSGCVLSAYVVGNIAKTNHNITKKGE